MISRLCGWFGHLALEQGDYLAKISFEEASKGGADIFYIPLTRLLDPQTTRKQVGDAIQQQLDARQLRQGAYEIYCNRHCFRCYGDEPEDGAVCYACGTR